MSDTIIELFQIDWQTVLVGIFVVLGFFVTAYTLFKKICEIFGIKLTFLENSQNDHNALIELQKDFQQFNQTWKSIEEYHNRSSKEFDQLMKKIDNLEQKNDSMQIGLKQILSSTSEERIRDYWKQGYIPEVEYDSFCDLLEYAINIMHCNHGLKKKYEECKEKLPMLSAQEAAEFIIKQEKEKEELNNVIRN